MTPVRGPAAPVRPGYAWEPDLVGPPIEAPADIVDMIESPMTRYPGRPAVVDPGGQLTYRELDALSGAVAELLSLSGNGSGAPVVVNTRLSRWAVAAMLAVLRAGLGYVPIDAGLPLDRQHRMAAASGATVALTEPGIPPLPQVTTTVDLSAVDVAGVAPARPRWHRPTPAGRPAYTCFTSGSTGTPKAVTISTAELAYSTAARAAYYTEPPERFMLCSSISFDSSVAGIYWTLAGGGRIVIGSDRANDPIAIAAAARRHRPTHLLAIPSLYRLLLRAAARDASGAWQRLRTCIVAGEPCPPGLVLDHHRTLPQSRLYNEYGPTECAVWSTVHACRPADGHATAVPVGRPIPGTAAFIRDPDGGPVPQGERGVLWIAGPGVAADLEHRPGYASSVGTVAGQRCYRTGDLVSLGADGLLRFHGRIDDQLKLSGFRVERAEIEAALQSHPAVLAAGIGVRAAADRPALVAFVVPAGDQPELDVRDLRAHLLTRLPAAAAPTEIRLVAALPLTTTGKVDRRRLDRDAGSHP